MSAMPEFARRELVGGLQLLCTLHLAGAPAAESIQMTAQAWTLVLSDRTAGWQPETDAGRITRAFEILAAETQRWPPPSALISRIPDRKPPRKLEFNGQLTAEQQKQGQENLKRIQSLINTALNAKKMPMAEVKKPPILPRQPNPERK